MILSKCAVCSTKKLRFIKKQEAKGLLTSLGFKTGLEKIPFFGDYLLWMQLNAILLMYKIIISYCLKYKNNTESINSIISKTKNGRTIILSKCAVCSTKKSRFIEK